MFELKLLELELLELKLLELKLLGIELLELELLDLELGHDVELDLLDLRDSNDSVVLLLLRLRLPDVNSFNLEQEYSLGQPVVTFLTFLLFGSCG